MLKISQFPAEIRENGVELPATYERVFALGLTHLTPWRFLDIDESLAIYDGLRKLYPESVLIPFARREDNDDVACLVVKSLQYPPQKIAVVHMFATAGYEVDAVYDTFWDWFRAAVDEMIEAN